MSRTLTIELEDATYEPLAREAARVGQTPEQFAARWFESVLNVEAKAGDPLAPFIGALHSSVPDWAERHDEYLAASLSDELSGTEDNR